MKRKIALAIGLVILSTTLSLYVTSSIASASTAKLDTKTVYYPHASLKSSISKYKRGNYTGCLQELFSLTKKQPSNAAAYYYMGLAYTRIGDTENATKAYDKAISINANPTVTSFAKRGKDCITGGSLCHPQTAVKKDVVPQSDLDKFINAPYGNGLSPEVNKQIQEQNLKRFQQEMNNSGGKVNNSQLEQIKDFDNKGSMTGTGDRIAYTENTSAQSNQPSKEEILQAIDTLKKAGLTLNVSPEVTNSQTDFAKASTDPDVLAKNAEYEQLNMLMGNNNGNNNNSNMMSMLPYLMNKDGSANRNINPQLIQTMLTSSMMNSFDFNNNKENNNY